MIHSFDELLRNVEVRLSGLTQEDKDRVLHLIRAGSTLEDRLAFPDPPRWVQIRGVSYVLAEDADIAKNYVEMAETHRKMKSLVKILGGNME